MTEQQIEAWVERQVDRLDAAFLKRHPNPADCMTQADYDARMSVIDKEAAAMLDRRTRD